MGESYQGRERGERVVSEKCVGRRRLPIWPPRQHRSAFLRPTSPAMRSQFRAGVDRQFETPTFGQFGLCCDFGNKANEPGGGLFDTETFPSAGKEEEHDTCTIKRRTLVRSGPDMEIAGQRGPAAVLIKRCNPFDVRSALAEHVPQGNDPMLAIEQRMQ